MSWALGTAAVVLMFTVAVNMVVLVKMNREHVAERTRLINLLVSRTTADYSVLQRASADPHERPKTRVRPNEEPVIVHLPEGL